MITNVSLNSVSPSFGLAKLSAGGKKIAQDCGIQSNLYLDPALYSRKSSLEISSPDQFIETCQQYGCSEYPSANAEFLRKQILPSKGKKVQKALTRQFTPKLGKKEAKTKSKEVFGETLGTLYDHNYDNELLKKADTKKLLEMLHKTGAISEDIYLQHLLLLKDAK